MAGISLTQYVCCSTLVASIVVYHAFATRRHFFPATVYLSTSKIAVAIMGNLGFASALCVHRLVIKVFLGALRDIEQEMIRERLNQAVMESLLALTIFREEFNAFFVIMFATLLFVKVLHWLVQDRVDYVEVTPNVSVWQHLRVISLMSLLLFVDGLFLQYTVQGTIQSGGQSVLLLFAFEYVIQASNVVRYFLKYAMSMTDLWLDGRWETKSIYVFYLELITDLLHLFVYVVFFVIVFSNYSFPLHMVRDLYTTFRNFRNRIVDFLRFRQVTARLDRFPDANAEDLARSDGVCIICREEMGASGSNKKLFCGHVFHLHCLRSWLERQQNCPTCRASVFQQRALPPRVPPPLPAAAPAAPADAAAGGADRPPVPVAAAAGGHGHPAAAAAAVVANNNYLNLPDFPDLPARAAHVPAAAATSAAPQPPSQQPFPPVAAAATAQPPAQPLPRPNGPPVQLHPSMAYLHHRHPTPGAASTSAAAQQQPTTATQQEAGSSASHAASGSVPPAQGAAAPGAGMAPAQAGMGWQHMMHPSPWGMPYSPMAAMAPFPHMAAQYAGQQAAADIMHDHFAAMPPMMSFLPPMLPTLGGPFGPMVPIMIPQPGYSLEHQAAAAAGAAAMAAAAMFNSYVTPIGLPMIMMPPAMMHVPQPRAPDAAQAESGAGAAGASTLATSASIQRQMLERQLEYMQLQVEGLKLAAGAAAEADRSAGAGAAAAASFGEGTSTSTETAGLEAAALSTASTALGAEEAMGQSLSAPSTAAAPAAVPPSAATAPVPPADAAPAAPAPAAVPYADAAVSAAAAEEAARAAAGVVPASPTSTTPGASAFSPASAPVTPMSAAAAAAAARLSAAAAAAAQLSADDSLSHAAPTLPLPPVPTDGGKEQQ